MVWPTALAYHFYVSGQLPNAFFYLALFIVAEALDGIGKLGVYVPAENRWLDPAFRSNRPFDRRAAQYLCLGVCGLRCFGHAGKGAHCHGILEVATAAVDLRTPAGYIMLPDARVPDLPLA